MKYYQVIWGLLIKRIPINQPVYSKVRGIFFVAEMGPILGLIKFDAKMYGNFEGLSFDSGLFWLVSYSCVFLFLVGKGVASESC